MKLIFIPFLILSIGCSDQSGRTSKNHSLQNSNKHDTSSIKSKKKSVAVPMKTDTRAKPATATVSYETIGYGQVIINKSAMFQPKFEAIHDKTAFDKFMKKVAKRKTPDLSYKAVKESSKINFNKKMVLIVYRYNGYVRPEIKKLVLNDKSLTIHANYRIPKGIMPMTSRNDIWTYEAIEIKKINVSFKLKIHRFHEGK